MDSTTRTNPGQRNARRAKVVMLRPTELAVLFLLILWVSFLVKACENHAKQPPRPTEYEEFDK